MGNLFGYARVSTAAQDPQLQLDALRAVGCAQVYVDTVSGAATGRPQLDLLLERLNEGDTLVVWRLDRLGRSLQHLIGLVTDLQERGVQLRSLGESIDTTTATGRLVFHVFGALAEFERGLLAERTQAGLTAARSRGRLGGRPSVMTADRVDVARQLLAAGKPITEIARTLGVSRATIYRHVGDPAPAGQ